MLANSPTPKSLSDFSDKVRDGIRHYHISNRPILSFLVILAIIGWQCYTIILILAYTCEDVKIHNIKNYNSIILYTGISMGLVYVLKLKSYQLIWFLFPCLTCMFLPPNVRTVIRLYKTQSLNTSTVLRVLIVCIASSEAMVYIFFDRRMLSVLFIVLGIVKFIASDLFIYLLFRMYV